MFFFSSKKKTSRPNKNRDKHVHPSSFRPIFARFEEAPRGAVLDMLDKKGV